MRFTEVSPKGREHRIQQNIGFIDNRIVFMRFTAKSAGGLYDPYFLKSPFFFEWEDQLTQFNSKASPGINKVLQTAGQDWCLMITELKIVETMKEGLIISFSFAFFALFLATKNIIMAFLSCLTIILIVVNVIA